MAYETGVHKEDLRSLRQALVKRLVASGEEPCATGKESGAARADLDAAGRLDAIEADPDATRKPDTAGEEPCAMRKEPDAKQSQTVAVHHQLQNK